MKNYLPVIGLEVHIELNTKTKMFCACSADYFSKKPNTHTCPVCLGLPGALPYINKEAIKKCMMISLALNCQITEPSLFERKNYFYPDLAKGFQTSQYRWPLCVNGYIEIEEKRIRINRVHQEEDTGKLIHVGADTAVDFNRAGVPLVEIVTEPDFTAVQQAIDYAKKLQRIFRDLGVSNADMERGDMRLEANVSVRAVRGELPDYRVELKNINSFKFMADAIEYEIRRQSEALAKGEKLVQETRGWDQAKKETYLQRRKEQAHDYRYFPEPDLPGMRVRGEAERVKGRMPKLFAQRVEEIVLRFGLSQALATTLVGKNLDVLFEQVIEQSGGKIEAKDAANYLVNKGVEGMSVKQLMDLLISQKTDVLEDEAELEKVCRKVTGENPSIVESFQKGKVQVIQVLIGGVMRETRGKANSLKVKEILLKLLAPEKSKN